jgi:hypothetical protein
MDFAALVAWSSSPPTEYINDLGFRSLGLGLIERIGLGVLVIRRRDDDQVIDRLTV